SCRASADTWPRPRIPRNTCRTARQRPPCWRRIYLDRAGEADDEDGADPGGALHLDAAAVGLDRVAGDRQAQAGALSVAAARAVGLVEALEDPAELLGGDAAAGVGDPQLDQLAAPLGAAARREGDHPADRGVLDGVVDEVAHHLAEAAGIAEDRRGRGVDLVAQFLVALVGERAQPLGGRDQVL